ncbi:hypothetical protein D3C80_1669590 [compost metagenome]
MGGKQAGNPACRRAGRRKLDIGFDKLGKFTALPAESPRFDDIEIADAAQRRDMTGGNAARLLCLSGAGAEKIRYTGNATDEADMRVRLRRLRRMAHIVHDCLLRE